MNDILSATEYLLMSAIMLNDNRAYGKQIFETAEELGKPVKVSVAYGSLYPTLERLHEEKLIKSEMSEPVNQRGGKSRRFYSVTGAGQRAMRQFEAMPVRIRARLTEATA